MKNLLCTSLALTLVISLTACGENQITPNNSEPIVTASYESFVGFQNDDFRMPPFPFEDTKEDALDWILSEERSKASNILFGIPVEITYGNIGEWGDEWYRTTYLFKITDNLPGNKLSEYIKLTSYSGDIFELGKEYCVAPGHNDSTLWDSHHFFGTVDAIPMDLLTESDIENLRKVAANMKYDENDQVVENASLRPEFISIVDVAVVVTIREKYAEERSDTIFDVWFKIDEVVRGGEREDFKYLISEEEGSRINSDVEVGGTYLLMFSEKDDGGEGWFLMPSARNGVVISKDSPEYADYVKALSVSSN